VFSEPSVTRTKFDRELAEFKAQRQAYLKRGVWLLDETFPELLFALVASKPKPAALVMFGVVINFENYDVVPSSVRLVDPFTRRPLAAAEVTHGMMTFAVKLGPDGAPLTGQSGKPLLEQRGDLVQAEDASRPGFICLQGVREYHDHPAHTGDSWFLHRGTGVGKLAYLLNALATPAIDVVQGMSYQVNALVNLEPRP
jgi:hypothetical protein